MQPEMLSLMQQLVTAVQSIALSVDVMSMDLRALNKNVAHLAKKEISKMSPLTLAPECSYSHDDEASSQGGPTSTAEPIPCVEESPQKSPAIEDDGVETNEKFSSIRDTLREDIRKALGHPGSMDDPMFWQKESVAARCGPEAGEGSTWEGCDQFPVAADTDGSLMDGSGQVAAEGSQHGGGQNDGQDGGLLPKGGAVPLMRQDAGDDEKKDGSYRCVWCCREFSDKYKLKRHWRVHTGEKPFRCFQCGKAFAHKENLIIHGRVHSGEKPFRCEVCGKAFARKEKLTAHGRIHTGEKPYGCELCGKSFAHQSYLIVHRRVHTGDRPYRCELCGKAFALKSRLVTHRRIHTGERPFRCSVCGKAFIQKDTLIVHQRVHTGERPFRCDVCGKAFGDSWKLKRHGRVHTEMNSENVPTPGSLPSHGGSVM